MANLNNFCEFYDMRLHKEQEDDILAQDIDALLNDFLPRTYVDEVLKIAENKGLDDNYSPAYIRHVRSGRTKDANVFMCILEVAGKYQQAMRKLKSTIEKVTV